MLILAKTILGIMLGFIISVIFVNISFGGENVIIPKNILISIMIIFLIGIIYYSYKVLIWFNHINENKKVLEKIEENIKITIDNNDSIFNIDFNALKNINPDTIAYIKVNNTNINYIVVKGNNNSYYLNHNFS